MEQVKENPQKIVNFSVIAVAVTLYLLLPLPGLSNLLKAQSITAQPSPTTNIQTTPWSTTVKKTVVFFSVFYQDGLTIGREEGTGFFVIVQDTRMGPNGGFSYFVTNRHMADPSIGVGHRVTVLGYSLRVNLTNKGMASIKGSVEAYEIQIPVSQLVWVLPTDPSVDLAIAPLGLDQSLVDYLVISESQFATSDVVKSKQISEGDSVLFTGFFAQFPGQKKIEPILREGILAMMPDEMIPTTLGSLGHLYLADLHAFHGNSGSPVFVNLSGGQKRTGNIFQRSDFDAARSN